MNVANVIAKVKQLNVVKVLAAATLAGGLLVAAAPAAQAQRFVVGYRGGPRVFYGGPRVVVAPPVIAYGNPYYAAPVYGPTVGVGFYGRGGWDRDHDRRFDRDHDRGGWGRDRR